MSDSIKKSEDVNNNMIHTGGWATAAEQRIAERTMRWWLINLVLGIILFISPWYSVMWNASNAVAPWNTWIFSAVMIGLSIFELIVQGRALVGIANALVAIWIFISPWLYGYGYMNGIAWSSWVIGVLVFIVTLWAFWQIRVASGSWFR
jgi:hypothetical protein